MIDTNQIFLNTTATQPEYFNYFKSKISDDEPLDWLVNLIKTGTKDYQVYKALVCLKNLSKDWKVVTKLYERKILDVLKSLLVQDKPQLVKVIAQLVTKMV